MAYEAVAVLSVVGEGDEAGFCTVDRRVGGGGEEGEGACGVGCGVVGWEGGAGCVCCSCG